MHGKSRCCLTTFNAQEWPCLQPNKEYGKHLQRQLLELRQTMRRVYEVKLYFSLNETDTHCNGSSPVKLSVMDRRNMLKKFLVPRTAFVHKDDGSPVAQDVLSAHGDNETSVFIISWQTGDGEKNQFDAMPAEDWFETDAGLFFRGIDSTGLLHLKGLSIETTGNACEANMKFRFMNPVESDVAVNGYVGFCFSADNSGSFDEKEFLVGITDGGHLFIGAEKSGRKIAAGTLQSGVSLHLAIIPQRRGICWLSTKVLDEAGNTLDMLKLETDQLRLCGGVCIVVQTGAPQPETIAFAAFRNITVQQKQLAASVFNSRPLHPDAEDISDATESFHHPYKITQQT